MKLPRDLSGSQLIKALAALDYEKTRQRGSHARVTTQRRTSRGHSITQSDQTQNAFEYSQEHSRPSSNNPRGPDQPLESLSRTNLEEPRGQGVIRVSKRSRCQHSARLPGQST